MATIQGLTLEINGNTQPLNQALRNTNTIISRTQTELRDVDRLLRLDPTNTELLSQRQRLLSQTIEETRNKLDTMRIAAEQAQEQLSRGEINEEQFRALQREIIRTEQSLERLENQTQDTQEAVSESAQNMGDSFQETGNKIKQASEKFAPISKAAAGIVTGFVAATEATKEYREDVAKLETNAILAGESIGGANKNLKDLVAITGEADSSVEGLSNLLITGFTGENLTSVIDSLSGAVIAFPDTLKIEGLADGLQETLATGKGVGPFSELLERMGINLDNFNAGLANATTEAEKQQYILDVLASTGLSKVNEEYRKNNEALIANNEAQYDLNQSFANLGKTIEPVVAAITQTLANLFDGFSKWFATLNESTLKIIAVVLLLVAGIAPLLAIIGQMSIGIGALIPLFGKLGPIISSVGKAFSGLWGIMLKNPFILIITAIVGIIGYLVYLSKTNENLAEGLKNAWEKISQTFSNFVSNFVASLPQILELGAEIITNLSESIKTAIPKLIDVSTQIIRSILGFLSDNLPQLLTTGGQIIKIIVQGISQNLSSFIKTGAEIISKIIQTIADNLPQIIQTGASVLQTFINAITNALPYIFQKIPQVIETIVKAIIDNLPQILTVGGKILKALIEGVLILNIELAKLALNIIKTLGDSFLNLMGDIAKIGANILDGIIQGIKNHIKNLTDATSSMVSAVKTAILGKKGFDIHSPSKWAENQVGKNIPLGVAAGIDKTSSKAVKAADDMAKEMFAASKKWIDEKKYYNELSLAEELQAWERVQNQYIKGSDQRIEAEKEYYRVKQEISKQVDDLEKKYTDAVTSRSKEIFDSFKLFDEVKDIEIISGDTLIKNLENQVSRLEEWKNTLSELAKRGINEGLIAEIQAMGPEVLGEIQGLLTLSDDQLGKYASLYAEKQRIANQQATKELENLRIETNSEIAKLTSDVNAQLVGSENVGLNYAQGLAKGINQGLPTIKSAMESIKKTLRAVNATSVENFSTTASYAVAPTTFTGTATSPTQGISTDYEDLVVKTAEAVAQALLFGLQQVGDTIFQAIPKEQIIKINGDAVATTTWADFEDLANKKSKLFAPSREQIASIAMSVMPKKL